MNTSILSLAFDFLENAKHELKLYDQERNEIKLRLACEKGWAAIAQALNHAAPAPIRNHWEFFTVAQSLSDESQRYEIQRGEISGHALHSAGFYRGELGIEEVRRALRDVEEALNAIKEEYPP